MITGIVLYWVYKYNLNKSDMILSPNTAQEIKQTLVEILEVLLTERPGK